MSLHMACEMRFRPGWMSFMTRGMIHWKPIEQRMHLAVTLAAENVKHHTGGPFGAIVVEMTAIACSVLASTW